MTLRAGSMCISQARDSEPAPPTPAPAEPEPELPEPELPEPEPPAPEPPAPELPALPMTRPVFDAAAAMYEANASMLRLPTPLPLTHMSTTPPRISTMPPIASSVLPMVIPERKSLPPPSGRVHTALVAVAAALLTATCFMLVSKRERPAVAHAMPSTVALVLTVDSLATRPPKPSPVADDGQLDETIEPLPETTPAEPASVACARRCARLD